MAAAIRKKFPAAQITTTPGRRGDFLVKADGKVLWDKLGKHREFPVEAEILAQLGGK